MSANARRTGGVNYHVLAGMSSKSKNKTGAGSWKSGDSGKSQVCKGDKDQELLKVNQELEEI